MLREILHGAAVPVGNVVVLGLVTGRVVAVVGCVIRSGPLVGSVDRYKVVR